MSLAAVPIGVACVIATAMWSHNGNGIAIAVIVMGVLWGGWALFLLFLSSRLYDRATPFRIRVWLLGSILAAIWVVVAGFGVGVSQGIH